MSGPFHVQKAYPYRAMEIWSEKTGTFTVNGHHLNHYIASDLIDPQWHLKISQANDL